VLVPFLRRPRRRGRPHVLQHVHPTRAGPRTRALPSDWHYPLQCRLQCDISAIAKNDGTKDCHVISSHMS
jgi:hypothetical protein